MRQSTHSAAAAAAAGDDVSLTAQLRARCEQLSQKCDMYEHEVNRLNSKLERFIHEVRQHCVQYIASYYKCVSFYYTSANNWQSRHYVFGSSVCQSIRPLSVNTSFIWDNISLLIEGFK